MRRDRDPHHPAPRRTRGLDAEQVAEPAALEDRLDNAHALTPGDLIGYASELGLDVDQFTEDLEKHAGAARIAEDVDGADLSNVSGTPTFFTNGRRHYGAYDIDSLKQAVRVARARATIAA